MVKAAILGFGTVGSGVEEVLRTNAALIERRAGTAVTVKYILDIRDFSGTPFENVVIRDFERIARKYGVDYAVKKDRSASPPKYLIFFKARDADALTAAFTEYTGKKVKKAEKTERPSVLAKLAQFKELLKNTVVDRSRRKELER